MIGNDKPCRGGWQRLVFSFALAAPLVSFPWRRAAPQAAGLLVFGRGRASERGNDQGRLVWGGETVPPVVDRSRKAGARGSDVCATKQAIRSHDLEVDPKTEGVAYGFAYLVRPAASNPAMVQQLIAKTPKVEIDQINCDFCRIRSRSMRTRRL